MIARENGWMYDLLPRLQVLSRNLSGVEGAYHVGREGLVLQV